MVHLFEAQPAPFLCSTYPTRSSHNLQPLHSQTVCKAAILRKCSSIAVHSTDKSLATAVISYGRYVGYFYPCRNSALSSALPW